MPVRTLFNLSFFMVLTGIILFAAGLIWRDRRRSRKVRKGSTKASVVRLELRAANEAEQGIYQNRYHPVLQYYARGQLFETVLEEGSYPSRWEKGQKVPIEYDMEDPSDFRISKRTRQDLWPEILYFAGIAFLAAGILLFIRFALRK